MPLGLISDDDFLLELENSSVFSNSNGKVILPTPLGRGEGNLQVPEGLRKIIGETSNIEGRSEALELASEFGISPSSVSAYANGATSTASYDSPNESLQSYINNAKLKVSRRASAKLLKALTYITEDKLENAKVGELASVAKNLSGIVKDMEPDTPKFIQGGNGPTIVLYAPRPIAEGTLDIVRVNE
jgi:transcriptional regulator with XRE-family HTH domain